MKILNRNVLKIIALITMLIDHIGLVFFPEIAIFRIIGRISFPIFAFMIAEGYKYTKSRKKYLGLLLLFGLISEPIYVFAFHLYSLNILFTFALSIILIYLIENYHKNKTDYSMYLMIYFVAIICLSVFNLIDYGFYGILLPVIFYFFKDNDLKYLIISLITMLYSLIFTTIQIYSLIALVLIYMYNNQKGKYNLKYLFYISYPTHILLLGLIALII